MRNKLENSLRDIINKHGYGFQYSVLKEIISYQKDNDFEWWYEVSEFPISNNNKDTQIDFILKNKYSPFYFVCECKRASPKYKTWVFLKAPFRKSSDSLENKIVREVINYDSHKTYLEYKKVYNNDFFNLHFEIEHDEIEDTKNDKDYFNLAITQVLKGFNGFIDFTIKGINSGKIKKEKEDKIAFFPVIFTTANIMISTTDISEADLLSGNIDTGKIKLEDRDFLFFQYNQSHSLKHSNYTDFSLGMNLSSILINEFTRTIAIVKAKAIKEYFSNDFMKYPNSIVWEKLVC